jgi:hypothetical protein
MKLLFTIALFLLFPTCGWCQKNMTPEEAIRRIINSGLLEGHDQKIIGGMGDAAAVIS